MHIASQTAARVLALCVSITSADQAPATVRCECVADAAICSRPARQRSNYGGADALRVSGAAYLAIMKFDLSGLGPAPARSARLRFRMDLGRLERVGVSTIATDWTEGTGRQGFPDRTGCRFARAGKDPRFGRGRPWAGPGGDLTDVIFGNGSSRFAHDLPVTADGDYQVVVVPGELIDALRWGGQHGLCIMDETGGDRGQTWIRSRESEDGPILIVEDAAPPGEAATPLPVTDLRADAHPGGRGAVFTWKASGGFAYRAIVESPARRPVPGWRVPRPGPAGQSVRMWVPSWPLGRRASLTVTTIDRLGRASAPAKLTVTLPQPAKRRLPILPGDRPGSSTLDAGGRVWILPGDLQIDPLAGLAVGSRRTAGHPNPVWDRAADRVVLTGARGEILDWQLIFSRSGEENAVRYRFSVSDLEGPGRIPADKHVRFFRQVYLPTGSTPITHLPDPLVPVANTVEIPDPDAQVPDQRFQGVWGEVRVPFDAKPGVYRGRLEIERSVSRRRRRHQIEQRTRIGLDALNLTGKPLPATRAATGTQDRWRRPRRRGPDTMEVVLRVLDWEMPRSLGFSICLDGAGWSPPEPRVRQADAEMPFQRLAHDHRTTLLAAASRESAGLLSLTGRGTGARILSWEKWDAAFGPYLDGSAFDACWRKGEPIDQFVLPIHVNWPCRVADYRPANLASPRDLKPGYAKQVRFVARQFADHLAAKGWDRTTYQLDPGVDGPNPKEIPWALSGPRHRGDLLALRHFAGLLPDGPLRMVPRIRPVHPAFAFTALAEVTHVAVLADSGHLRMRRRSDRSGTTWVARAPPAPTAANVRLRAWCWRMWLAGADGVLLAPVMSDAADLSEVKSPALIYPGPRGLADRPVASMRLKMIRRVQQDIEYIAALCARPGWDRASATQAVIDALTHTRSGIGARRDEAGNLTFPDPRPGLFEAVRAAVPVVP